MLFRRLTFRRNAVADQMEPAGTNHRRNSGSDCGRISLGSQWTPGTRGHRYSHRSAQSKKEFSGPAKFTPHARPADATAEGAFSDTIIALLNTPPSPWRWWVREQNFPEPFPSCGACSTILNIPTFATVHGLGAVPPQSPYYLGMVGMHGTRAANMALHETDLLMVSERGWMIA